MEPFIFNRNTEMALFTFEFVKFVCWSTGHTVKQLCANNVDPGHTASQRQTDLGLHSLLRQCVQILRVNVVISEKRALTEDICQAELSGRQLW